MAWRYFAEQLDGAGGATILDVNVPITGANITDNLSAPARLSGTITPEFKRLLDDNGSPLIEPYRTAIWAEEDGVIRGGGLLVAPGYGQSSLDLDCIGLSGYPVGQTYTDSNFWVQVDPLDMLRVIYAHLQSKDGGDLAIVVDPTTSPVRIGTELTQVEFDTVSGPVSFEAGPYKLAWYQTDDLGKEVDDLAESTPFDFRDRPSWNADRSAVIHRVEVGYPRLGGRRHDLRFRVGENVVVVPDATFDDTFATGVVVLGAGEGRDMVRGYADGPPSNHVRRILTVQDKTITSVTAANARARAEVAARAGSLDVTEIVCREHDNAPVGSVQAGDDIYLESGTGYGALADWFRVLSVNLTPDDGSVMNLSVSRSDKVES